MAAPDIEKALADLEAAVTKDEDADSSAETLIVKLAELYAANKLDPARIQAITDRVVATSGKLSDAVVANTPAEPTT
jgi:hypothetical protein